MKRQLFTSGIMLLSILSSCTKKIQSSVNGDTVDSNAGTTPTTLAQKVDYLKAGLPPYDPRLSDTIAAARNGNGAVMVGNSQLERWQYYNYFNTWKGVPIIDRGIGGTTWSGMYAQIQKTTTDYRPKVIVLYQGENEYNGLNLRSDSISKVFVRYFDETRRQNPTAHIVVLSMLKIPLLLGKGLGSDIEKLNGYYQAKTKLDSNSSYVDISSAYPRDNKALWRPDSIHINDYVPLTNILKPVIVARLSDTTTRPTDTVVTPPPVQDSVINGNRIPVANAGADVKIGISWNYSPTLYGTTSKDSDGWIAAFEWSFVKFDSIRGSTIPRYKIATPTAPKTKIDSLSVGVYTFRVKVTDNKGATATDDVVVTVQNN